jgi:Ca2+-transporting ATPase
MDWYKKEEDEVVSILGSDREKGLNSYSVDQHIQKHGLNIIAEEKKSTIWSIVKRQTNDFIIYILILAATISSLIGKQTEYLVIMAIVGFIVVLGVFEEYKASKDMEALKKLSPKKARVKRNGLILDINAEELVPGDIIILRKGDIVGADARLLESKDLAVDESSLTGESIAATKKVKTFSEEQPLALRSNMLFASTKIVRGSAVAIVTTTGTQTEIGIIASLVKDIKEEQTPLQKKLTGVSIVISLWVSVIAIIMMFIGLLYGQSLGDVALLAIAVAVAGIPESLPAVVAVCLALGMKRMAKQGALVKRLAAVETLGACSVICTDKTGTLTQNKMSVEEIITINGIIDIANDPLNPDIVFIKDEEIHNYKRDQDLLRIIDISLLCNNAERVANQFDGEPTEIALLQLGSRAGFEKQLHHKKHPRILEHPFDHDRKMMSVIHSFNNQKMIFVKGAPEVVLKKCSAYVQNGALKKINPEVLKKLQEQLKTSAAKGMRVLAFAYKRHISSHTKLEHIESDLIFAGFAAMRDPPQPQVKEAVLECQRAGIRVIMITGDNPITAQAIASEVGIYHHGDVILTGSELDSMTSEQLMPILDNITVFARTTPKHKLRIVEALQSMGLIVAMTGDGVNDAPALKKADVGVAMGISGTEVAKEAAEMVLLDDNFKTIVSAVREGRTIFSNIRKFIYYLLSTTIAQVVLVFIAISIGLPTPLTALMILFINLITSDLPAIGLAAEKSSDYIMRMKPRDPKENILSEYLLLKMLHPVPIFVLGTLSFYMWSLWIEGHSLIEAQTIAFATMTLFCIWHGFNSKSFHESVFSRRLFNNPILLWGSIASLLATILVVNWPVAQEIFGFTALSLLDWVLIFAVTLSIVAWVEIQKLFIGAELREKEKHMVARE